ncbi:MULTISPECIES: hypothetical protein [Roseomonadaceae]|uniref:Uncharacterized protein n=1 Tax=Falsiroseomonas oleicola TaxID=2801474 RepID=A0ABS6HF81_9PROT|nr:hypothetical protein [Roseomonas oleicola]MBU8546353.1 hypothetical protein [Roseomonas oleicola]
MSAPLRSGEMHVQHQSRCLMSFSAQVEDDFERHHAKVAFLWFENIILDELGRDSFSRTTRRLFGDANLTRSELHDITDAFKPLGSAVGKLNTRTISQSRFNIKGYPRWGQNHENYTYPDPETAAEAAHNAVLAHLEVKWNAGQRFTGIGVEYAEGASRNAVDGVLLWDNVKQIVDCSFHSTDYEKIALLAAVNFGLVALPYEPVQLFTTLLPDLSSVSWRDILALRRRHSLSTLRTVVRDVYDCAAGDLMFAQKSFKALQASVYDEIIDKYRPNLIQAVLEGIASNIPTGMLISPISAALAVKSASIEALKERKYGWVYLLRDAKRLGSPAVEQRDGE